MRAAIACLFCGLVVAAAPAAGHAEAASDAEAAPAFESGRLLATAGVSQFEGAAGGGLNPWALIAGYGTQDSFGASAHATGVFLPDYTLGSFGAAIGIHDRIELSYAHLRFGTGDTGRTLGIGQGYVFGLDIIGAKLRLFGDAVYAQDSLLPQVAFGVQYKISNDAPVLRAIGASASQGVDLYLAATKLLLEDSLLLNATLFATRANQFGILGFGGDRQGGYRPQAGLSAALLLSRNWAIGAEFRSRPDNLRFAHERNAFDAFVAWWPDKAVTVTLAYADLGGVAGQPGQRGPYLSLQLGF